MSATKVDLIKIYVTAGDCIDANRKSGKSNTGTYFISSLKSYDDFELFFAKNNKYVISLTQIEVYKFLFHTYFEKYKDEYTGQMKSFDDYCDSLLSLDSNPEVEITTRVNEPRVFMRFLNNNDPVVKFFRGLLYEDLSLIAIEKIDDIFHVYPTINEKMVQRKTTNESGISLDE